MPKKFYRVKPAWVRLMSKRVVDPSSGCWIFTGGRIKDYGAFYYEGRNHYAHRWIYARVVGPIPEGYEVDHLCKNPPCFNPEHLEAVTQYENNMRSDSKTARMKRQTECLRGHPLSGHNLMLVKSGPGRAPARVCRTCKNESYKAFRRRPKSPVVAEPSFDEQSRLLPPGARRSTRRTSE